jgi:Domain of unknown function (DUF4129)
MRRGAAVLAAAGAVLLVVAAWATTAPSIPILRGAVPNDHHRGFERQPRLRPPPRPTPPDQTQANDGFGLDITIVMYVLLLGLLALLALLLARRLVLRRRVRKARVESAEPELVDDEWDGATPEGLARSASRGLAALSEGDPRNAIVQCWTELEDAVVALGFIRDPALTSEEFTAEVLQRYALGRGEIETLGALYREARFSEHAMSERHRAAAVDALTALRDELRAAAAPVPAAAEGQP